MALTPQIAINMQHAIERIEGVTSSRIILDDQQDICECHILASTARHPKQISKDVQSVLATTFDYRINHRVISVAQIQAEMADTANPRIIYRSVDVTKKDQMITAKVTCQMQEVEYSGEYTGVATKNGDFRAVAEATLDAVRDHTNKDEHIVLEGYRSHELAGVILANVVLTFVRGEKEYLLVGTAVIGDHIYEAYAKAVFDALNRILFAEEKHDR